MFNSNDQVPISPMKKLKILSEKQQNVQVVREQPLGPIKEGLVTQAVPEPAPLVTKSIAEEPLMQESSGQYVIFPINNRDMWQMYKHLVDSFWSPAENMEELDKLDLNPDERQCLKFFSSFFSSPKSHGLVVDTFAEDFAQLIQVTEARFFYGHQLFVQDLHYEMLNKMLDRIASTPEEKDKLHKIVEGFDAVQNKRNWIKQWEKADFGVKMAASACIHGIFFISLDIINTWLKTKLRVSSSHEMIEVIQNMIADQELFRDFACLMLSHVKSKPSRERILDMINSSVKIEFDYILNGLKLELIQFESDELIQIIDRKTKALKNKIFGSLEENKVTSVGASETNPKENEVDENKQKESHQKIVFDEEF